MGTFGLIFYLFDFALCKFYRKGRNGFRKVRKDV